MGERAQPRHWPSPQPAAERELLCRHHAAVDLHVLADLHSQAVLPRPHRQPELYLGKGLSTAGGDIGAYYQGDGDARTQNFLYPRADRGPNTGDIKSYFSAEWVYEVPQAITNGRFAKSIFGGWQVSGIFQARTGEPVTLTQTGALQINHPDYIGGEVYFDDYRETLQYLNRSAFGLLPLGAVSRAPDRPANVGNGAIRAPGSVNLDFSIGKSVPITEHAKVQLRADMFNALNHTNLNGLRNSLNDAFFGQLLGTAGARVVQLNARFSW